MSPFTPRCSLTQGLVAPVDPVRQIVAGPVQRGRLPRPAAEHRLRTLDTSFGPAVGYRRPRHGATATITLADDRGRARLTSPLAGIGDEE